MNVAASMGGWPPAVVISVLGGVLGIVAVIARVGDKSGQFEEHLKNQDATLAKQDEALAKQDDVLDQQSAALARQDQVLADQSAALAELRDELRALRDQRH